MVRSLKNIQKIKRKRKVISLSQIPFITISLREFWCRGLCCSQGSKNKGESSSVPSAPAQVIFSLFWINTWTLFDMLNTLNFIYR